MINNTVNSTVNPIRHTNKRLVNICGAIVLNFYIEGRVKVVRLHVAENLVTKVNIELYYRNKYFGSMRPRKQNEELADGTTVPIIWQTDKRTSDAVPLREEHEHIPESGIPSNKIKDM